jgi:hypothetical protein
MRDDFGQRGFAAIQDWQAELGRTGAGFQKAAAFPEGHNSMVQDFVGRASWRHLQNWIPKPLPAGVWLKQTRKKMF